MKKRTLMILLVLLCLASTAFGQKKVAVYASDMANASDKMKTYGLILSRQLGVKVSQSSQYAAAVRTDEILAVVNKEHAYERGGSVDNNSIAEAGKQLGVDYVLVVTLIDMGDGVSLYVDWQLVNVVTAIADDADGTTYEIHNMAADLQKLADQLAERITKGTPQAQREEEERLKREEEKRLAEQRRKEIEAKEEQERLAEQRRKEAEKKEEQERIQRPWRDLLNSRITTVTTKWDSGSTYVGQRSGGSRNGLGLYRWTDGDVYFGRYDDGERSGIGIYIAHEGSTLNNCPNGVVYVGEWKNDKKSGTGTVYDKNGKLIYYGKFLSDKPIGKYPTQGMGSYTFEVINCSNGDKYVGELKDGHRQGRGFYIWQEGSGITWYGWWSDDKRNGYGILIYDEGKSLRTGTWKDDK